MKTVNIDKVIRKHFVEQDNKQLEVRSNSTIDHYPADTTIFENKLVKGAKAGTSEYWVPVKQWAPSKRVSSKETIAAILADAKTMSAKELEAKYGKVQ